jgi:sulfatase modifying factor 1
MKTIPSLLLSAAIGALLAFQPVSTHAQSNLTLQMYAGVGMTGTVGSVYAIQTTTNPANSNSWTCAALVQLAATNYVWADTARSATGGQRYYRAVLTATNLVFIQPGTFTMGSPTSEALRLTDETQHVVTISKGFYLGKGMVTQGEYLAVVGSNPSFFNTNTNLPVEQTSWVDATNYCALRTQQEQAAGLIPTNYAYRLPTESEFEYATRAGTITAFYLGSTLSSGQVNFNGQMGYNAASGTVSNPSGVWLQKTTVAGSYAANGWGLYDMTGNDCQWCQDWYDVYPTGSVVDPQGPATGTHRTIRAGNFNDAGQYCRSAIRNGYNVPTFKSQNVGFRVVLAATH